jgi:NAD+ synthase
MLHSPMFSADVLTLDADAEIARIVRAIRRHVLETLRKRGAVLGLSGGIDSSVVAALCARALGREKVLGLFMPDRDSSDESLRLGRAVAAATGIEAILEDVEPVLEAAGCYQRQMEAIQSLVPEYGEGWKCKLSLPSAVAGERLNVSRLTVLRPGGEPETVRLTAQAYLKIVAATNFKQRVRKTTEYYHADRLNYAVAGTPNRLEYDQGFFVKQGDGAADFKPIAHLYKTQVYQLAMNLGVPEEIHARAPTTDTFSMPQTQEEFYFALPYDRMDLCVYAFNRGIPASEVAPAVKLSAVEVERVFRDIAGKRRATRYLHAPALLVEDVPEIDRVGAPADAAPP